MIDHHLLYRYGGKTNVANPANHLGQFSGNGPHDVPTSRKANTADMTAALSSSSTELLDYLADDCGYKPHEVQAVGHTLGLTEAELATLQEAEDEKRISIDEARKRVRFAAVMTEAVIDHRAAVSTPDILTANEATLREWVSEIYPAALDETWAKIDAIEKSDGSGDFSKHAGHGLATAELRRRLWYWWQVCQRLGADPYTGYLKGVGLTALDEFEAGQSAAD